MTKVRGLESGISVTVPRTVSPVFRSLEITRIEKHFDEGSQPVQLIFLFISIRASIYVSHVQRLSLPGSLYRGWEVGGGKGKEGGSVVSCQCGWVFWVAFVGWDMDVDVDVDARCSDYEGYIQSVLLCLSRW